MTCSEALQRRRQFFSPVKQSFHLEGIEDHQMYTDELTSSSHFVLPKRDVQDLVSVVGDDELDEFMDCILFHHHYTAKLDAFDVMDDCTDDATTVSSSSCSSFDESDDDASVGDLSTTSTVFLDAVEHLGDPMSYSIEASPRMTTELSLFELLEEDSSTNSIAHSDSAEDINSGHGSLLHEEGSIAILANDLFTEIEVISRPSSPLSVEYASARNLHLSQEIMNKDVVISTESQEPSTRSVQHQVPQTIDHTSTSRAISEGNDECESQLGIDEEEKNLVTEAVNVAKDIWEGSKHTPVGIVVNVTEGVFGHIAGFVQQHLPHDDAHVIGKSESDSIDWEDVHEHCSIDEKRHSGSQTPPPYGNDDLTMTASDAAKEGTMNTAEYVNDVVLDESRTAELPSLRTLLDSPAKSLVCRAKHAFHDEEGCAVSLADSVEEEWIPL